MTDAETEFLEVEGGRIAFQVSGRGPLVLCAPGMGDLKESYRHLVPVLTNRGYRVAIFDNRGHGESSTGWASHGQTAIGRDMVALIDHLGGPAVVVGQSFTPDSALVAATERADDVEAAVLIAPWATMPRLGLTMRVALWAAVRFPRVWTTFYASLYPGEKPADFRTYCRALGESFRRPDGMSGLAAMARSESRDAERYRSKATQPVLIVMGSDDPDFDDPRAEAEAMAAALTAPVEVVMVEGAGHYPHAQAPVETGTAIVEFLNRVRRTDA